MNGEEISKSCKEFAKFYFFDVCEEDLISEILHLKSIHQANFGGKTLKPIDLLNIIHKQNLQEIFSNISIALRIFGTFPITIASGERTFSKLSLIKNYLRSTMGQARLNDFAVLSIESDLARKVDFGSVIDEFAKKKARKAYF